MTVASLRADMSNMEFLYWTRYYGRKQQREELANRMAGG